MKLEILKTTAEWWVINKPAKWHSVSQAKGSSQSLQSLIENQFPSQRKLPEGGLVHRLDFETSGCLLVARTNESYNQLRDQISTGEIKKVYWALTTSKPVAQSPFDGRDRFEFFFSSRYRSSKKVTVKDAGKTQERGQCEWTLRRFVDGIYLWEVELLGPGRRHQIRAGFATLKAPLLGDQIYGGHAWIGGIGLHAQRLIINSQVIEAPVPSEWGQNLPKMIA